MPEPLTQQEVLEKLARGEPLKGMKIGDINFSGYAFKRELNFSNVIFTGEVIFEKAQFLNGADFYDTQFLAESNFIEAQFSGEERANFMGAKFFEDTYFIGAKFSGKRGTSFIRAKFSGERTFFAHVQFTNMAFFSNSQFSGEREVSFLGAKFYCDEGTDFRGAIFSCDAEVDFSETEFSSKETIDFRETQFSGKQGATFRFARFLGPGKTKFEKTNFKKNSSVCFERIEIDPPEMLEFIDVSNLGSALFLYTDLEKISFKNVRFRQTKNKFSNREYLADEERNKIVHKRYFKVEYDRDYYNQIEILYRQLKLNFENQRDYARAGDFHYGELEMQRKAKMLEWEEKPLIRKLPFLKLLKYFNLTQCYKIISGYGEKWQQALASFIVVWILFTGLNLPLIEPKVEMPQEQSEQIEQWNKHLLHRLGGSALFSFKVLTLQRWEKDFKLKGTSYFPGFFIALQHLIGPTIIALMLLAIRRQFRR